MGWRERLFMGGYVFFRVVFVPVDFCALAVFFGAFCLVNTIKQGHSGVAAGVLRGGGYELVWQGMQISEQSMGTL